MAETQQPPLRPYPIQLGYVSVNELSFEATRPLDTDFRIEPQSINIVSTFGKFNPSDKSIQVGLGAEFGWEEQVESTENSLGGAKMRVRIVGHFSVDEASFPVSRLEDWGRHNAAIILFPFLREHVFSLSVRCGIAPIVLPLVYLPTVNTTPDVLRPDGDDPASSAQMELTRG